MKLKQLLESEIRAKTANIPSPAIRWLVGTGPFDNNWITILDYGSGPHSSPSVEYMRDSGLKVYSYDPYTGKNIDGWKGVSNKIPNTRFDYAVTTFFLNRVSEDVLEDVLDACESLAMQSFHIVRHKDLEKSKKSPQRKVDLTDYGYTEYKSTHNYKIFHKKH